MKAGLAATSSEIVVFLDADVINTAAEYVPRLVQPLLEPGHRTGQGLLRAAAARHARRRRSRQRPAARPSPRSALSRSGEIRQPLAGETASRRTALESVDLESAYGVEIALLIDIARQYGVHSLAQVDLGVRRHRNRPLEELRPMAVDVLRAALGRFKVALPPQS